MTAAIYARKSRLSESGDSVENQIKLCGEYIRLHKPENTTVTVYQDEGYSGGNTARPQFKTLQKAVKAGEVGLIVCYRLDRISRNVMDFSAFLESLQERDIGFVSLRENFDTTTPMGRAMIYISSVFAQLERETIAERVRDNLFELSKSRRFISPKTPEGYKKIKIYEGKRYHYELEKEEEEFEKIKSIFDNYLQWRSIHKIQTWSMREKIRTRRGAYYKCGMARKILTHPIYCRADKYAYDYFTKIGCQMVGNSDEWDGSFGVSVFRHWDANKGGKKSVFVREPKEWVVSVGTQPPMIDSLDWIKTQEYVQGQTRAFISRPYGGRGILTGTLKCAECGGAMRSVAGLGDKYFYYACEKKRDSSGAVCGMKNVRGDILDALVLEKVGQITKTPASAAINSLETLVSENEKGGGQAKLTLLTASITENNAVINGLLTRFALAESDDMARLIGGKIAALRAENAETEKTIDELKSKAAEQPDSAGVRENAEKLVSGENFDMVTRRNLLRNIISKAVWDGETLRLEFGVAPQFVAPQFNQNGIFRSDDS